MRWYLNPLALRRAACDARAIVSAGGPARVRLNGVSRPHGWFLPGVTFDLEVVGRDGTVRHFEPEVPVPWPAAWSYRIADRLGVPVVSDIDPGAIRTEVGVPGR